MPSPPPPPGELYADLAPSSLPNRRQGRYLGDDLCLPLTAFSPGDQQRIHEIYRFLGTLFALFDRHDQGAPAVEDGLRAFLAEHDVEAFTDMVRGFGAESRLSDRSERMGATIHDLRGGGLSPLLGQLQLSAYIGLDAETARTIFFLTRDHLKIMRNALLGLDDAKRAEDLKPKLHGIGFIVEKWQNAVLAAHDKKTKLQIECSFQGNISECCVEFGALDRVLYNFINNACRHSAGDTIKLNIAASSEPAENLRFVLLNQVTPEDEESLARRDLRDLFKPGVSTTGSGLGMTVGADFVTNAYGLGSRETALNDGYLGAKVARGEFLVWFHWPIAPDV